MDPNGRALITGASRGIGRALAGELAERGFDVLATMRDPAMAGSLADHPRIEIAPLDLTRPAQWPQPSSLRVLVNCGGADTPHRPLEFDSPAEWRAVFETNFFGPVELMRAAVPALRAAGGGVIVNVTSISVLAPVPFYALYRSSKAALAAVGESLRTELAPFGIRLLEVLPGPIDTDMFAASGEPPPALDHEEYRVAAAHAHKGREAIESAKSSVDVAARQIADAILDDDAPLKVSCDPVSEQMLSAWRGASSEEEYQRTFWPAFVPPRGRT